MIDIGEFNILNKEILDIPAKIMNWENNQMERFDGKPEEISLF